MDIIRAIEQQDIKQDLPDFKVGDNVKVHYRITEGNRSVGVERTFPVHSPKIDKIEIVRHGRVRRAKLYYLRDKVGKAAKIKEKSFR